MIQVLDKAMNKISAYTSIFAYPPDWMLADVRRKENLAPRQERAIVTDQAEIRLDPSPPPVSSAKSSVTNYTKNQLAQDRATPATPQNELYAPTRYTGQRPAARYGKVGVMVDYSA